MRPILIWQTATGIAILAAAVTTVLLIRRKQSELAYRFLGWATLVTIALMKLGHWLFPQ